MSLPSESAGSESLTALLHGPDRSGLVARVAGWIFEHGGNILHADQHRDEEEEYLFQRIEWTRPRCLPAAPPFSSRRPAAEAFAAFAGSLGMTARVSSSLHRPKVALFVSKADHCFHDLALRWKAGEFRANFAAVVSNHTDIEAAARGYGLPFHHIPASAANKAEAESRQLALLRREGIELVVLARYMQILSGEFLGAFGRPVINIHHSFLPAFAGSALAPYHQAHARGSS